MEAVILFLKAKFVPLLFSALSAAALFIARNFAAKIGVWVASKVNEKLDVIFDNIANKTKSEAGKALINEAREIAKPLIVDTATTISLKAKEALEDGKITAEECETKLKEAYAITKIRVDVALKDWKVRAKPILSDPDQIVNSIMEEIYQTIIRNFERGSSAPAPAIGAPKQN